MPRHAITKYRVHDLSIISATALSAPRHQRLQKSSFVRLSFSMSYRGTDPSLVENANYHERVLLRYGKLILVDSFRISGVTRQFVRC
jgi:hypothetical protein